MGRKVKYKTEEEKRQAQLDMQTIALNKADDHLKNLTNKHLFLTQEKTELAFQLKQMLAVNSKND